MTLDICATHVRHLLVSYKPGCSLDFAQNLLLPTVEQMQRLSKVEDYIANRESTAKYPSSESFSAQYFDQSPALQTLLAAIIACGEQEKIAKIQELARLRQEYERLMTLSRKTNCQSTEVVVDWANNIKKEQHSPSCQKRRYAARAKGLRIHVQDWPFPATPVGQKVVVFELQPPASHIHWRDSVVLLTTEVLKADHTTESPPRALHPLAHDSHLSRWWTGVVPSRRIGLLSEDKPHSGAHFQ